MKRIIFIIILVIALLFLYGKYIETNNIKIRAYVIETNKIPKTFEELKIVHFSDLLYNKDKKKLDKILKKLNNENADIIIFSGDLFGKNFSYKEEDYNNLKEFLTKIDASLYKYAVIGDNDEKYLDKYKDILYESGFILLDNESTLLFYKDNTPINIIGLTNTSNINELFKKDVEYEYNLVITHKPDLVKELKIYDIDTVLSGHSLGGIVNVPYYGGLIKKEGSNTYINDHYIVDNTNLYINNGLGYNNYEFRLFNTPSINIYRFKKDN